MSDNTEITVREADANMAARFISESDGDFPELSALFARHAAQARLEALEEAASFIEQRSDIHANSRTVLATAIRSLSTRGDQK